MVHIAITRVVYLGARMQCDGADDADVPHRMVIAQITFGLLSSIWTDHLLSCAMKRRTYQLAVCSTLTHASEAWALTDAQCERFLQPLLTRRPQNMTCFVRFASVASVTSAMSCACPRVEWCDAPWWHLQKAAPSTLRAASLWTARQWR